MTPPPDASRHALSFAGVAEADARARPGYPDEAVAWLVRDGLAGGHDGGHRVVELGAGTGLLTASLVAAGHAVVATDPLPPMLRHLVPAAPGARVVAGRAEQVPVRSRWADVVVSAQAYHWFDRDRALPEIARVLRPGGRLGLVWNERDERIPWVRRLGRLLDVERVEQDTDPVLSLLASGLFGFVEQATFRFWQPLDRDRLRDLVSSRSHVALLDPDRRARLLADVDALYDDYGRGPDGMLLPYVTRCFRAVVRAGADPDDGADDRADGRAGRTGPAGPPDDDSDTVLIDLQ